MSKWVARVRCKCGHAYSGEIFSASDFRIIQVCPTCGSKEEWRDTVERWVSTSRWNSPRTWGTGYWEVKA